MKKFCLFVFMCIAFISCNKNLPSNENEISVPDDPEDFFDDQKIEKRPVEYPPLSEYFFNEKENCYIINNVIRFPKIQNARMVDRSHMSRGYDGVRADKNVLTMEYNGSLISVIIICPYHNTSVQRNSLNVSYSTSSLGINSLSFSLSKNTHNFVLILKVIFTG